MLPRLAAALAAALPAAALRGRRGLEAGGRADEQQLPFWVILLFFPLVAIPCIVVARLELSSKDEKDELVPKSEDVVVEVAWSAEDQSKIDDGQVLRRPRGAVFGELSYAVALGVFINWSPIIALPVIVKAPIVCLSLLAYLYALSKHDMLKSTIRSQGLRRPSLLSRSSRDTALVALLVAFPVVGVIGWRMHDALPVTFTLVVCCCLYPIWGVFQQWLVQGLLTSNLAALIISPGRGPETSERNRLGRWALVVFISGLGFSACHYPDSMMMTGTFALGLVWASLFLRDRDIFPLGFWHGIIGAIWFFWVIGQDPLSHMFCMLRAKGFKAERACSSTGDF